VTLPRATSPEAPYANIAIGIAPQDADGVGLNVVDLDVNGNGLNKRASLGTTTLRYGRLKIANAYGSDVLPLPVDVRAQAWNGSAFVDLPDDNCTPLGGGYFTLAPVGALQSPAAGTTSIVGSGTLNAGKGRIALTRLTAPISGKVITAIKTAPALDTYLPGVGTGTFGVYRSGPVIYRRELHY
jgi:MSHA biogenesis protein MshQ